MLVLNLKPIPIFFVLLLFIYLVFGGVFFGAGGIVSGFLVVSTVNGFLVVSTYVLNINIVVNVVLSQMQ